LVQHLPHDSNRGYQALFAANEIVNTVLVGDRTTYQKYAVHSFDSLCSRCSLTLRMPGCTTHGIVHCYYPRRLYSRLRGYSVQSRLSISLSAL